MSLPALFTMAAAAFPVYYYLRVAQKPMLFYAQKMASIVEQCPSLLETFYPTWWMLNGHMSTVFGTLIRRPEKVEYTREIIQLSDGGELALDWSYDHLTEMTSQTPIVILLHGITGSSEAFYIKNMVHALTRHHICAAAMNYRGIGVPLKTPQGYNAAFTQDLREVVLHVKKTHPENPVLAVGVSLGSIILVKYLDEEKENCPLLGGVSLSNPWNLHESSKALSGFPSNLFYNSTICTDLKKYIQRHMDILRTHPVIDPQRALAGVTRIRHFDEAFIVPSFGYDSLAEYYDDASSVNHLKGVAVPLLFLNAADDPFCPGQMIPTDCPETNPNLIVALTNHGGHLSFAEGLYPKGEVLSDRVAVDFCLAVLAASRK